MIIEWTPFSRQVLKNGLLIFKGLCGQKNLIITSKTQELNKYDLNFKLKIIIEKQSGESYQENSFNT